MIRILMKKLSRLILPTLPALLALLALLALSCLLLACERLPLDDEYDTYVTESPTKADTEAPAAKMTYTVTVKDQNGDAVAGVAVQMCDDMSCMLPVLTNENGVVTFTYEPGNYHVTIPTCPEGYTVDATREFHFPEGSGELTVEITKN